jgi:hypothetical protein
MQQRQLRLGDTLDDYCPRERRLTNHVIVAMIGDDVKQTRCTTCDSDHEYKHAKVPRQRKKGDTPAALYAQVAAGAPKRVAHDAPADDAAPDDFAAEELPPPTEPPIADQPPAAETTAPANDIAPFDDEDHPSDEEHEEHEESERDENDGPIHRRLIRASLPRPEGQQPPARPIPEFTIRQPGGRPNRFRPRHGRGGGQSQHFGNRSNGNFGGPMRGGGGGSNQRHHGGRKRSK